VLILLNFWPAKISLPHFFDPYYGICCKKNLAIAAVVPTNSKCSYSLQLLKPSFKFSLLLTPDKAGLNTFTYSHTKAI